MVLKKKQLFINAAMSLLQVILISINLFLLYRFLLKAIGVENLGIWSVVIAITSVSQIANFGLSGSVVKFVSKYLALNREDKVSSIIQTAVITTAASVGVLLLLCFPIARLFLNNIVGTHLYPLALSILPLAFIAFWLLLLTSVTQAGIDGSQRIDIRSWILIGDSFSYLILCYVLARKFGLMGLAYARVLENALVLSVSWIILRKKIKSLPLFPFHWSKSTFKEIFSYSFNFQIMSVGAMLHDPVTKVFISKFGGMSMTGYYEMAAKMIWQIRALIASSTYAITPAIAHLKEKRPRQIKDVYWTSYQLLLYLALPLFSLIVVSAPLASLVWIGHYQSDFVFFSFVLALGWFFNILSVPAYYAFCGIGDLRWNVRSVVGAGLLNVVLGYIGGLLLGGKGAVLGWVSALIIGGVMLLLAFSKIHRISMRSLFPKTYWYIGGACFFGIISVFLLRDRLNFGLRPIISESIIIMAFLVVIMISLWSHPLRKRILQWIREDILAGKIPG